MILLGDDDCFWFATTTRFFEPRCMTINENSQVTHVEESPLDDEDKHHTLVFFALVKVIVSTVMDAMRHDVI